MEQREIKFRGLRSDNGGWVTGSYHCCKGSVILHSHDYFGKPKEKDVVLNNHWILTHNLPSSPGWTISDTYMAFSVIPESVGQYTGLKAIYEGDIVSYNGDNFEVVWAARDAKFILGKIFPKNFEIGLGIPQTHWDFPLDGLFLTVIGNKFQNPELLNPS